MCYGDDGDTLGSRSPLARERAPSVASPKEGALAFQGPPEEPLPEINAAWLGTASIEQERGNSWKKFNCANLTNQSKDSIKSNLIGAVGVKAGFSLFSKGYLPLLLD